MPEETAPPFENWVEHLKELGDRELMELAKDYRWLDEEAKTGDEEFHRRRQAVIAECERRGMRAGVTT